MKRKLLEFEHIGPQTMVADTSTDDIHHPVIAGFRETLFNVAGRIQPGFSSYPSAQRILDIIEHGNIPDENNFADLERVFTAAGGTFERIMIR